MFLVMLLRKKNTKRKPEPVYYNAKTEAGRTVYASAQDDYYTFVNKDRFSKRIEENSQYAYVLEDWHNSKQLESSQVYEDIDHDVKNKFIQSNAAKDEAKDDITQIYSTVNMSAKTRKMEKQEKANSASTLKCMEISDMYAEVDKNAKKKSQEENMVDEYAVVDKSAKKRRQEQKNVTDEYAVVDKSVKKRH